MKKDEATRQEVKNHDFDKMKVKILSKKDDLNGRVMCGKGLLNTETSQFEFIHDSRKRNANPLVKRTNHITARRGEDGEIRATLRFEKDEKHIQEQLLVEIREIIKQVNTK